MANEAPYLKCQCCDKKDGTYGLMVSMLGTVLLCGWCRDAIKGYIGPKTQRDYIAGLYKRYGMEVPIGMGGKKQVMKYHGSLSYTVDGISYAFGVEEADTIEELRSGIRDIWAQFEVAKHISKASTVPVSNNGNGTASNNGTGGRKRPGGEIPLCPMCNSNVAVDWLSGVSKAGKPYGFYKCVNCDNIIRPVAAGRKS